MAPVARRTIELTIRGGIERAELPGLAARVCALFAANRGCVVSCDVTDVPVNAVTVEALARLQLVARRNACQVVLRNPSDGLRELVFLMGLSDVLPEEHPPST